MWRIVNEARRDRRGRRIVLGLTVIGALLLSACVAVPSPAATNPPAPTRAPAAASPTGAPAATKAPTQAVANTTTAPAPTKPAAPAASPASAGPPAGEVADAGRAIYATTCAGCHGDRGQGITGPPVIGPNAQFGRFATARDLLDYVQNNMPMDRPGSLTPERAFQVTGFLLVENGYVQRGAPLDAGMLGGMRLRLDRDPPPRPSGSPRRGAGRA